MIAEVPLKPEAEQRLDFHLSNWSRWMRSGEHVQGYKHGAAGCVGGGYTGDFDDMVAAADRRTAIIMDTLISDLPENQCCAVHNVWINKVFRLDQRVGESLEKDYAQACDNLLIGMNTKGLW